MKVKSIFVFLTAAVTCGNIHAQQEKSNDIISAEAGVNDTAENGTAYFRPLGEITIEENRLQTPFAEQNRNIRVLDQELIRTLPVKSVNELLTYVSGVDVRQRGPWGAQTDIGIDGGTFDQTLVLINGIKVSDPQTGHNMMNLPIPLDAIDRVEVLRGPAARIYGVNALTGAINIITKKPTQSGISAHVYAGSSFNKDTSNNKLFGGYGIQLSGSLADDRSQHYFSLSREQTSGYRYNTAFHNNKAFYQNNIDITDKAAIQFLGGFVYNDFGANGFYSAPGDKEAKETVQTGLVGLGAKVAVTPYWTIKPRISYRYNHDDYIYIRQKPEVYRNRHETHVIDAEFNNTFETTAGTFGLGLEARNERISSSNLGKWDRTNYGIFGEYSFSKVQNLLVTAGAYANYNSDFGWSVLPGIDAGYRLYKGLRVFANAGAGQRLPTYTDWYYKGPQNIGNDRLTPEYSYNVEGGLKYNDNQLNASVSYFYRRTNDFIDWVKDTVTAPWQPRNFHKINTNGFTLSADYRWQNESTAQTPVALITGLSYTYLSAEISDAPAAGTESEPKLSRYALENLRHQLCANVNLELYRMFAITVTARYQERINYKNYVLLDSRISFTQKQYSIYADVTNLSNVQYIEAGAVPMPGRWVTLGFKCALWRK
jgi:vitamin B12 transporter